ncbi:transcriptional repressor NrdR [Thermoleophilia bacterium SCSIO 60948]|nr:transcriptional repressor NrdR [Thermoleophilia bacterium SCSIO 60948]
MRCSVCDGRTRVAETRTTEAGTALRRRRVCLSCGARATTFERFEAPPAVVVKRSGEREPFDRSKLRAALLRATHKRPVDAEQIERIVERVEAGADGEIEAAAISEAVLEGLVELDFGAYLQFAGTLPDPIPQIAASTHR